MFAVLGVLPFRCNLIIFIVFSIVFIQVLFMDEVNEQKNLQSTTLPHRFRGVVVHGFGRGGKKLKCPTANLDRTAVDSLPVGFVEGIYAGLARVNESPFYPMVMSVGYNVQFDSKLKTVEVHILKTFQDDFYGANLEAVALHYLRPMRVFSSLTELIEAIEKDKNDTIAYLHENETAISALAKDLVFTLNVLALNSCIRRKIPGSDVKIVCVCNATYCDEIEPLRSLADGQAAVYLTNKEGKRLEKEITRFQNIKKNLNSVVIRIDPSKRLQNILGFGGAFTDAVGINLNALSTPTRNSLIRQYYGEDGIGYTIGRVPIASCDFSSRIYSYLDVANDFDLKTFKLAPEDLEAKIPYLIQAMNLTNGELKLFGSPWSAPYWMKTSGRMKGGGTLKGQTNGPYYRSYARYLVRFFQEYANHGVLFWGLTTQNEPSSGMIPWFPWQTMYYSAREQREFVINFLGPFLRQTNVTSQLKLMVNDDNLFLLPWYPNKILSDPTAASFIDGVGIHWYFSDFVGRDQLNELHDQHPEKFILSTEACTGSEYFNHGPNLGSWNHADRYARDIIGVLKRWVVGWVDWNLCLNEQGGPNWASNFVDSPIIVNASTDEFYKQPMFYVLAHFSKFIPPGSVHIDAKITGLAYDSRCDAIAFITPSNQRVLVVHNENDAQSFDITIKDPTESGSLSYEIPASSIATFIWNKRQR
ncbi:Glucosylceramidase [Aphelenchoides besseyi]|nr:Glucosylceramidase [Aphelenchoides besseyi]